jgi:hypothetical protein
MAKEMLKRTEILGFWNEIIFVIITDHTYIFNIRFCFPFPWDQIIMIYIITGKKPQVIQTIVCVDLSYELYAQWTGTTVIPPD